MKRLIPIALLVFLAAPAFAQFALMPAWRQCFTDATGVPLAGGQLFSYAAGTSTPLATYVDYSGTIQNTNPVILDSAGCTQVWVGGLTYKFVLEDASGAMLETKDNVSDLGLMALAKSVLLLPPGRALQTIAGPLAADYFQGVSNHTTSPNVRVGILDPNTILDTPTNPPNLVVDSPAGTRTYRIFDPLHNANFVMNPNGTGNVLDCSQDGITCRRTAHVYFEGGGCNNTNPAMGWDTFGTNSPIPRCVTGSNIQKGILAFPAAATLYQDFATTQAAATTIALAYPNTTVAGDLLLAVVGIDTTRTVSGCTDGTNAYTLAKRQQNGAYTVELWYFNGNSAAVAGTLTCTLSGSGNSTLHFLEYTGILTASMLDVTASNGSSGTAVTTGTTAGTAQNTELIIAAMVAASNPTITGQSGWVQHATTTQSTNIVSTDEGKIQQTTSTQAGSFTLSVGQGWAAVIATFKVNVQADISAQRTWFTPTFFSTTGAPVASGWVWQTPQAATGTVNVSLGAQVVCTAPGTTDDPSFNAAQTATAQVSATGPNIVTSTALTPLDSTGCTASNLLHLRIFRQRYNANDTYEGYVYLLGAPLFFGINQ